MNAQRLMDLARFLHNELPVHKFNFQCILRGRDIPNETFSCGTVGCAIGWAPLAFPEDLQYIKASRDSTPEVFDSKSLLVLSVSTDHTSMGLQDFFGITRNEAHVLFMPNGQHWLPDTPMLSNDATPKEVASNIALFVRRGSPQFDTSL